MNDYIFLAMIAVLSGGIGLYTLREAKAYRQRVASRSAELWDQSI